MTPAWQNKWGVTIEIKFISNNHNLKMLATYSQTLPGTGVSTVVDSDPGERFNATIQEGGGGRIDKCTST